MQLDPPLQKGQMIRRYKRFLADIQQQDGEETTVHCPNTGSMRACLVEGSECWYSESLNLKRKYSHTLEVVTTETGHLAGINTHRANHLVKEALQNGTVTECQAYSVIKPEVRITDILDNKYQSRLDFLLQGPSLPDCYLEVKNVTLCEKAGEGLFPDAVSKRGAQHLEVLTRLVEAGYRGILLFCVQHTGIERVQPADSIDPVYGETLRMAASKGVEVLAYRANISINEIRLVRSIPVIL